MTDLLTGYPVVVEVPVAWGDMDAFQHVNNTRYLRWFEDARLVYFDRTGWMAAVTAGEPGPILARTTCVFRVPVTYPDTVRVGVRAVDLGEDRFTMEFAIHSTAQGVIAAHGDGRIVSFDYETGAKAPIPATVRGAMDALEGR